MAGQPPKLDRSSSPIAGASNALQSYIQMEPDVEQAIFSSNQQVQELGRRQSEATLAQGEALARSATLAADSAIAEQETHKQILRATGLDILDPTSMLSQELAREAGARRQRETIDNRITELEGISFWQNPFAFLMAQPELQQLTAQYNQLARQENTAAQNITEMRQTATTVSTLTPAKNADMLRAKSQADAEAVRKQAEAAAANISAQNAAGNAKAMLDIFNARHNMFASVLQVQDIEERIRDRRQREADANFWRQVKLEDLQNARAEKAAEKDKAVAITSIINQYRRAISGSTIQDLTVNDVKMMPAQTRELWYEVGLRGNYGNDYSQSIPFINAFGNVVGAAQSGNATMMQMLKNVQNRVNDEASKVINEERTKNPMAPPLKRDDAMRMAYQRLYSQDASLGMQGSDKSNVTGASPYALNFEEAAKLSKLAIANKTDTGVLGKMLVEIKDRNPGVNLNISLTPRMLLNEMEARVTAGSADPKQAAAELSRFVTTQAGAAYRENGLRYFNLPQATDWNVYAGGTGKTQVDLMNPAQVENYLTARAASNKRINRMSTSNSFGIFR